MHVAIVQSPYADSILSGEKTIEARFARARRAPYGRVHAGERLYFKRCSGGYFAVAEVVRVLMLAELNPVAVGDVRDAFDDRIRGMDAFWEAAGDRRYATLVTFAGVVALDAGPDLDRWARGARRSGWHALPDRADPERGRQRVA